MILRKRRLYRQATQAWKEGAEYGWKVKDRSPDGLPAQAIENDAVRLAWHQGWLAGAQWGPAVDKCLPVEVWSLVLAEKMRP